MRSLGGRMTHGLDVVFLVLCGTVATYSSNPVSESTDRPTSAPATPLIVAEAPTPSDTYRPTKLLKVEPVKGYVGDSFAVKGDGLRGCPETKSLKDNSLCFILGKTKNGITGESVSYHAFSNF